MRDFTDTVDGFCDVIGFFILTSMVLYEIVWIVLQWEVMR